MKLYKLIWLFIFFMGYSCSYLPAEVNIYEEIKYEETTEYIKLVPDTQNSEKALMFLPGGLVDSHSYISLFNRVAQEGMPVFILKVSANLAMIEGNKPLNVVEGISEYNQWYICGHSLGGVSAQGIVSKKPDTFAGLILLGVYPAKGYSLSAWNKNCFAYLIMLIINSYPCFSITLLLPVITKLRMISTGI